ncbi:MAG: hypothetical protein KDA21_05250, partial [Phycisphaerales bacterium]|nr:hypothetical protein [Phycisphaerales bacterium]
GAGEATSHFDGMIDGVRLSSVARYSGDAFPPVRRMAADDGTVLLLQMDGQVAAWLYDEGPQAAHALLEGDAAIISVER